MDNIEKLTPGTKRTIAIFGSYIVLVFSCLLLPYYCTVILLFVAFIVIGMHPNTKKEKRPFIRAGKWHPFQYL